MGSFSIGLEMSPNDVFSEIQQSIATANYKVENIVSNQNIIAEGRRDFSLALLIALVILVWPVAIIYYFTRHRSSVTVTITKKGETECNLTVSSNGKPAEEFMGLIKNSFQKNHNSENS